MIPQFQQAELTLNCVQSFLDHHSSYDQIIVVDDASDPEQKRTLHRLCAPRLFIIPSDKNRGITHAWNRGLSHCKSDVVVLLNNDVLTQGEWLDQLVAPLCSDPDLLCGAAIRTEPLLPQSIQNKSGHSKLLQGWCLAFERKLAEQIGPFDERMSLYFSDTDWQCRWINHFGAKSIKLVDQLPMHHLGGQTTNTLDHKKPLWLSDRNVFINKWRERDESATGL